MNYAGPHEPFDPRRNPGGHTVHPPGQSMMAWTDNYTTGHRAIPWPWRNNVPEYRSTNDVFHLLPSPLSEEGQSWWVPSGHGVQHRVDSDTAYLMMEPQIEAYFNPAYPYISGHFDDFRLNNHTMRQLNPLELFRSGLVEYPPGAEESAADPDAWQARMVFADWLDEGEYPLPGWEEYFNDPAFATYPRSFMPQTLGDHERNVATRIRNRLGNRISLPTFDNPPPPPEYTDSRQLPKRKGRNYADDFEPTNYGLADDESAFHQLIRSNPFELTNHRVYADWLADHGYDNAEAYRRQLADLLQSRLYGPPDSPQEDEFGYLMNVPRGMSRMPSHGIWNPFNQMKATMVPAGDTGDPTAPWQWHADPRGESPLQGLLNADSIRGELGLAPHENVDNWTYDAWVTNRNRRRGGTFAPGHPDNLTDPEIWAFDLATDFRNMPPEQWPEVERVLTEQWHRGPKQFAGDDDPTHYGTEQELIQAINQEPREISAHLGLADWYADNDKPREEDFRRQLAAALQRPWTPPRATGADWLADPNGQPDEIHPYDMPTYWNLSIPRWDQATERQLFSVHPRNAEPGYDPETWTWQRTYNPTEAHRSRDRAELLRHLGLTDDWTEGGLANFHSQQYLGLPLSPVEKLFMGIDNPQNANFEQDSFLWPMTENLFRRRFNRGLPFDDTDQPTAYGAADDELAFLDSINKEHRELSNHLVFADWLSDQERYKDEEYRRKVAEWIQGGGHHIDPQTWLYPQHGGYGTVRDFDRSLRILNTDNTGNEVDFYLPWRVTPDDPTPEWIEWGRRRPQTTDDLYEVIERGLDPDYAGAARGPFRHHIVDGDEYFARRGNMELTTPEQVVTGLMDPNNMPPESKLWPGGNWHQVEKMLRHRFDHGQQLSRYARTDYGTEEELIRAINAEPREVSAHLGLADWYADNDRPQDEAYRRALAQLIGRRMSGYTPPTTVDPNGMSEFILADELNPEQQTRWDLPVWQAMYNPRGTGNYWTPNLLPMNDRNDASGAWQWWLPQDDVWEETDSIEGIAHHLGYPTGTMMSEIDPWDMDQAHTGRHLSLAERVAVGLVDLPHEPRVRGDWDPHLWPAVEQKFRRYFNRGVPFYEDEHAPTQYGTLDDERAFRNTISDNPLELTNHLVFADWLADQDRAVDEGYQRQVAEWVRDRLGKKPQWENNWLDQSDRIARDGGILSKGKYSMRTFSDPNDVYDWTRGHVYWPYLNRSNADEHIWRMASTTALDPEDNRKLLEWLALGNEPMVGDELRADSGYVDTFQNDYYWSNAGPRGPGARTMTEPERVLTGVRPLEDAEWINSNEQNLWREVDALLRHRHDQGMHLSRYSDDEEHNPPAYDQPHGHYDEEDYDDDPAPERYKPREFRPPGYNQHPFDREYRDDDGRDDYTRYGLRDDENAFWDIIRAQPQEVSNHQVFSDFLRDQGREHDANYRQAVADTMQRRLSAPWYAPTYDRYGFLNQHHTTGPMDDYFEHVRGPHYAPESMDVRQLMPSMLPGPEDTWTVVDDSTINMTGWGLPGEGRWHWDRGNTLEGMRPLDQIEGHQVGALPSLDEWRNERWQGLSPGSPPTPVSRWISSANHPHLLNPAEQAFAGITNPADITNEKGLWDQIEELMRDRWDRGQRLSRYSRTDYGDRESFVRSLMDNPHEATTALVFADWLQENGEEALAHVIRGHVQSKGHGAYRVDHGPAAWSGQRFLHGGPTGHLAPGNWSVEAGEYYPDVEDPYNSRGLEWNWDSQNADELLPHVGELLNAGYKPHGGSYWQEGYNGEMGTMTNPDRRIFDQAAAARTERLSRYAAVTNYADPDWLTLADRYESEGRRKQADRIRWWLQAQPGMGPWESGDDHNVPIQDQIPQDWVRRLYAAEAARRLAGGQQGIDDAQLAAMRHAFGLASNTELQGANADLERIHTQHHLADEYTPEHGATHIGLHSTTPNVWHAGTGSALPGFQDYLAQNPPPEHQIIPPRESVYGKITNYARDAHDAAIAQGTPADDPKLVELRHYAELIDGLGTPGATGRTNYGLYDDIGAFQSAIRKEPRELSNHLVFADFLQDHGLDHDANTRRAIAQWVEEAMQRPHAEAFPGENFPQIDQGDRQGSDRYYMHTWTPVMGVGSNRHERRGIDVHQHEPHLWHRDRGRWLNVPTDIRLGANEWDELDGYLQDAVRIPPEIEAGDYYQSPIFWDARGGHRTMTPAEELLTGVSHIDDYDSLFPAQIDHWYQVEQMLRNRFDNGQRLESGRTPTQYADIWDNPTYRDELAFLEAISRQPQELSNHQVLADWYADHNRPEAESFRRGVGDWMQEALGRPTLTAEGVRGREADWVDQGDRKGSDRYFTRVWRGPYPDFSGQMATVDHYEPLFTKGGHHQWGNKDVFDVYGDQWDELLRRALEGGVTAPRPIGHLGDLNWDRHWIDRANPQAGWETGQRLTPAENFLTGTWPIADLDPEYDATTWPMLQQILRDRFHRGQRLEEGDAPTAYGTHEDEWAFRNAITTNPLELTNHQVFADWLSDQGRNRDEDYRRQVAAWIQDRLGNWTQPNPPIASGAEVFNAPATANLRGWLEDPNRSHEDQYDLPVIQRSASPWLGLHMRPGRFPNEQNTPSNAHLDWRWWLGGWPQDDPRYGGQGSDTGNTRSLWHPDEVRAHLGLPNAAEEDFQYHQLMGVPGAMNAPDRLLVGIDDLNNAQFDQFPGMWNAVEQQLERRFNRGVRLEDDATPTHYGDENAFRRHIASSPVDLTAHGAYADWLSDHERFEDESFRRQVMDSIQRRLGNPAPEIDGMGWLQTEGWAGEGNPIQKRVWEEGAHMPGPRGRLLMPRILPEHVEPGIVDHSPPIEWDTSSFNDLGGTGAPQQWRWGNAITFNPWQVAVNEDEERTDRDLLNEFLAGAPWGGVGDQVVWDDSIRDDTMNPVTASRPFSWQFLTPTEELFAGVSPWTENNLGIYGSHGQWWDIENMMKRRFDRQLPFAEGEQPTHYDDEQGFIDTINREPREIASHQVFADWLADQGRTEDEAFRRAMAANMQDRLGSWEPPEFQWGINRGFLNLPRYTEMLEGGLPADKDYRRTVNYHPMFTGPNYLTTPDEWMWAPLGSRVVPKDDSIMFDPNGSPLPNWIDWHEARQEGNVPWFPDEMLHHGGDMATMRMSPAEQFGVGVTNPADLDPRIWPQIEAMLRNRHDRGLNFSAYGE